MKYIHLLLCTVLLPVVSSCYGNDSIARVAAGGISFQKTDDIEMRQEILEISTDLIRVNYRFFNKSDHEVRATIAFPMPPYGFNPGFSEYHENEKPIESFLVKVDGRDIAIRHERRAKSGDKDITAQLRAIGLNDAQIFENFALCADDQKETEEFCGVTKEQQAELEKVGGWKVHDTAIWEQTFPPHKEISVEHEYAPFVGQYYFPAREGVTFGGHSETCDEEGSSRAVDKQLRAMFDGGARQVMVFVSEVEYILGTGRNWSGPIGDFRLRITKGSPTQVISLCFPGKPNRLDAQTIEFDRKNFIPEDSLRINFYDVKKEF